MRTLLAAFCLFCAVGCGNKDCDDKLFSVTCTYPPAVGQCNEFTGLSTADEDGTQNGCLARGGVYDAGPCTTAGRIGSCFVPNTTPNIDVGCSPSSVIHVRYYSPYDMDAAVTACAAVIDGGFTPN
jgi:hypothetical protein